jgi:hypothetical protein
VRSPGGVSRNVLNSRIIHAGDTLITGVDSLAVLSLADVGTVRLGPGSTATASATPTSLSVSLDVGSMCAQAQTRAITIHAGGLAIAAGDDTAIFSLIRDAHETTIAVYQGQISSTRTGKSPIMLRAGEAAVSSNGGEPVQVPIQGVQPQFAALKCPDDLLIARVVPSPEPSAASGAHGGGGGGFLGILLGIGALAALAGHGGGGGGGGGNPPPTPPPGPGLLTVNPASLSFLVPSAGGTSQPFTASESNYTGAINASSGDATIATVSPASGTGPGPVTFTVTPVGAGSTSITVTDNHGGTQVVSVTVTPPGVLSVNPTSLSFLVGGASQPFTASETSFAGLINAVSNDTSIATVSPSSGTSPATFNVTPTGVGTTTIKVTDGHGGNKSVTITVTPPGSIIVSPSSLTFITPGAGGTPQPFTAREASYTGAITATSNDTGVATVSGSGNGPGPVTFTVTPVGPGTTMITVNGGSAPAHVNITVIGPLTTNPTSLTFSGTTASQDFTASDPLYGGTISASVDNPTIASVAPSSLSGPSGTFHVTPLSEGNTNVTVTDTFGETAKVSIVVSSAGLSVNPTILTFTVTGAPQTFTATENNYTGPITATSNHPGQATVSPASANGPTPPPFTVTPVSAGNASIAVSDTHAHTKFVDIDVTGPLTPTPTSLTFNGTTATQNITVSDPNYFGSIGASSSDLGVATVTSPGTGPSATFTVTPVNQPGAGRSATINYSDANGGTTSTSVQVNPGTLGVSKSSIILSGSGSTDSFTASETLYSGLISAASTNISVATVSPASGSGPGPVSFTVTATGPGTATINTTDNHGGLQTVSVTVTETPTVGTLATFTDVGGANTQSPSVTESGYSGTFSVVGNTCGSIASVGPIPGTGPSTTVPVTPLTTTASGGPCQFQVKDNVNGGVSSAVNVTVGPFGTVVPSPSTLNFSDVGSGAQKTFTVSESGYTGNFTLDTSSCSSSVATASPAGGSSATTFTVTPVGSGTCTINVNDDHTQTATVTATVASFGSIVPTPASLTFTDVTPGQMFTVNESGYTGKFTIDKSPCAGIATVSPLTGDNTTTFTVTPSNTTVSGGTCNVNITDDHASPTATLSVTVGPFGALAPSPTSLFFKVSGGSQTFTVGETNYSGNFTIDATKCSGPGIATESPGTGTTATTFTVTPGAVVGNCAIKVSDDHGGQSSVIVSVTAGTLTVDHVSLSFASPGSPSQTFMANDVGAATFSVVSSDVTIATVLPASQLGPGPVTFTVTPDAVNTGTAQITVTDNLGGSAVVSVGVGVSPLVRKRHPIVTHKPVGAPAPKPRASPGPRAQPPVIRQPIGPVVPRRLVVDGGVAPPSHVAPSPSPLPTMPAPVPALLSVSAANILLVVGAQPQTIVISEPGYTRLFNASTSNAAVAAVSLGMGSGPTLSTVIIPRGIGVATIRIADDHGGVRILTVTVRSAVPIMPHQPGARIRAP